jgi:hypothetical protein
MGFVNILTEINGCVNMQRDYLCEDFFFGSGMPVSAKPNQ